MPRRPVLCLTIFLFDCPSVYPKPNMKTIHFLIFFTLIWYKVYIWYVSRPTLCLYPLCDLGVKF